MDNDHNTTWFKDGILYSELHGKITLESMLDMQRQGTELVQQYNIDEVPNISIMTDVKNEDFEIKLHDFSKVIASKITVNHASVVWLVGANEILRKKYEPLVKMFFISKIRFVDTLEQAETEAREMIQSGRPVSNQD